MKKVKMDLAQLNQLAKTLDKKSITSIKGGGAAGDPPPFGVFK